MKCDRDYLTTAQVAEFIGKSEAAVRNLVLRRKIPYRKPGGRLCFLTEEIRSWIQDAPGVTLQDLSD